MRLRVETEGLRASVYNADTGEDLSRWVSKVSFEATGVSIPKLTVEFLAPECEIVGDVTNFHIVDVSIKDNKL